jgi:hypothetical protein
MQIAGYVTLILIQVYTTKPLAVTGILRMVEALHLALQAQAMVKFAFVKTIRARTKAHSIGMAQVLACLMNKVDGLFVVTMAQDMVVLYLALGLAETFEQTVQTATSTLTTTMVMV